MIVQRPRSRKNLAHEKQMYVSSRLAYLTSILLVCSSLWTGQAHAANVCEGFATKNQVTKLGGKHTSFSQGGYVYDTQTLQDLFVKYRADLRRVMASQGLSHVATPLFNAVHRAMVTDGEAKPGDSFKWMAWRKKGKPTTTAPLCLNTDRSYKTFEVKVPVEEGNSINTYHFSLPRKCLNLALVGVETAAKPKPEKEPEPNVYPKPNCNIVALPDEIAVGDPVSVDVRGAWAGISVAVEDVNGNSVSTLSVPFPQVIRFDKPGVYTIKGVGTNEVGDSANCEAAVVSVSRSSAWTVRPFAAGFYPADDIDSREVDPNGGIRTRTNLGFNSGLGAGVGLERHLSDTLGVEGRLVIAQANAKLRFDTSEVWENDEEDLGFVSATIGPNFHLTGKEKVDFFVGPFVGVANIDDANLSTPSTSIRTNFDTEFVYGLQLGFDIRMRENSPWKLHAGIMKMIMEAEDGVSGEEVDLDPTIAVIGAARDF